MTVATVTLLDRGVQNRSATLATNQRDGVSSWQQLRDVMFVGTRQDRREWYALRFSDEGCFEPGQA